MIKSLHGKSKEAEFSPDLQYHSPHNNSVASFLFDQLKEKDFSKPYDDIVIKRKFQQL